MTHIYRQYIFLSVLVRLQIGLAARGVRGRRQTSCAVRPHLETRYCTVQQVSARCVCAVNRPRHWVEVLVVVGGFLITFGNMLRVRIGKQLNTPCQLI